MPKANASPGTDATRTILACAALSPTGAGVILRTVSHGLNAASHSLLHAFLTVMKHIQRPDFLDHIGTIMAELHHLEPVDIIAILPYVVKKWRQDQPENNRRVGA